MHTTIFAQVSAALTFVATTLFVTTPLARAAATPEQQCQKGRHDAAGKYAQCELKAMAKFFGTEDAPSLNPGLSKCLVKYAGTWLKLQKKAVGTGATCDAPRFVDASLGYTVVDNLTGLEWRKKALGTGLHGQDTTYSWIAANSVFVKGFNDGMGFEVYPSDWRLPTRAELQTILSVPCATSPCIDPALGPTVASYYWTATREPRPGFVGAWVVNFGSSSVGNASLTDPWYARAVRGGLGGF